jgi:hypothetical protein
MCRRRERSEHDDRASSGVDLGDALDDLGTR